jgi:hypothetical protein
MKEMCLDTEIDSQSNKIKIKLDDKKEHDTEIKLELTTKPNEDELLIEFDPEADLNDVEEIRKFIDENWGETKEYIEIHFL